MIVPKLLYTVNSPGSKIPLLVTVIFINAVTEMQHSLCIEPLVEKFAITVTMYNAKPFLPCF